MVPGARSIIAASLAGLATWLVADVARASPLKGSLHVARDATAEACPDEAKLRAQIEAALGRKVGTTDEGADVVVDVRIEPDGSGFVAVVSARGKREGERRLQDPSAKCEVLSGALAITVAIMLEGDVPAPVPKVPWYDRYYLLPAIDAAAPEEPPDNGVPPLSASVGAIYDAGRLDGDAPGLTLGVDVLVPYVTLGVELLSLPEDRADFATLSARFRFLGGRFRVCSRQPFYEQFGASFCGLLAAGERRALLLDPDAPEPLVEKSGGYAALGIGVDISRRIYGPVGVYADLTLEFPFVADTLTLEDAAIDPLSLERESAVFDMGVGLRFWLDPGKDSGPGGGEYLDSKDAHQHEESGS
jgi:hypothetical protein